jgi:hypothetical protein
MAMAATEDSLDFSSSRGVTRGLMTGLHACGDLTCSMLSAFVSMPTVRVFAAVGCCYHAIGLAQGSTDLWFQKHLESVSKDTCASRTQQLRQPNDDVDTERQGYCHQPPFDTTQQLFHHCPMSRFFSAHLADSNRIGVLDPFSMHRASASNVSKNQLASDEDRMCSVQAGYHRALLEEWLALHPDVCLSNARTKMRR